MHLPHLLYLHKPRSVEMDPKQQQRRKQPRLDRRNAVKNIDYDAVSSLSPESSALRTRSLDLPHYTGQTSFRIEGVEGEFDLLCRNLGLSGPEDFAIPTAAWEARKARSSSDLFPRSRLQDVASANSAEPEGKRGEEELVADFRARVRVGDEASSGGIRGVRPPVLSPPPAMSRPVVDMSCSTWDILRSLAPDDDGASSLPVRYRSEDEENGEDEESGENEEVDGAVGGGDEGRGVRLGETADLTGSCSFSTSNDDDSSSTTTEAMFVISPDGKFKRNIKSWIRGGLLGSGSFGTVYEGISDDGFFFAVKEVSLLDQGSQAQQCILQLEQEIALLSQFEHENIVQYLGTDKEEAKLYIFLELVTQGSLARLYEKYHLRDSQVSAYTRQILSGLKYLHDRNVMHRDIKCANILVDASGSVKLADFGLAKETSKLNMLKSCKGSAFWMAPEVVNPRKTYGLAADIWSLGCSVLEMLTRTHPYSQFEWMQALYRIGHGEPPPVPNSLSREARDFIQQCLQVEPEDRPSASELLDHPFVRRPLPTSMGPVSPHNNKRA
ncbi:mitogen-activated protein kinase kinase kinase 1-like [Magnolia sinica]|uniref:mitogen-activated protein kinase kinase kinase 1-like n=1 Tax=Magnolia sinica TaxID=86752 RepID=UPI002658C3AC|nr:mitogen-activated protein kinase kinase kinase 1-like [Magnolia sinica]